MARKVDSYLEEKSAQHGKKPNQKLKPYVVLQYLLKYTDENNVANGTYFANCKGYDREMKPGMARL